MYDNSKKIFSRILAMGLTVLVLTWTSGSAMAGPVKKGPRPTAAELGFMKGPHGPGEHIVGQLNWTDPPYSRWGLQNARAILPSATIYRRDIPVSPLPKSAKTINGLTITDEFETEWTLEEVMESTYTDGFLVVHKGRIVHEQYWNDMKPWTQHLLFSVSKSYTGLIAGILEAEGKIDFSKKISDYILELRDSAWTDTTIRNLLDMNTAVDWSEDTADYEVEIAQSPFMIWALANNWIPRRPEDDEIPDGNHDFLTGLSEKVENKGAFHYKSVDTDMAGWVLEAASGESFADLMSSRIWSKIGAEQDTSILVDQYGAAASSWGLSITLRDMGRVGTMMAAGGYFNGEQIIPKTFAMDLAAGGDRTLWKNGGRDGNGSYRSFWWHRGNDRNAYMARGAYGQFLYIDHQSNTAIIRLASQPGVDSDDSDALVFAVFDEVIEMLEAQYR